MAANSVLAKLAVQISANTAEFNKNLSATQKNLTSFSGNITKIAGAVGVAFGVQEVASFGLEISKLAGEAQGVRAAFERLPNSTRLMMDLKDATGNTVSELDLMKRAVQASNFDISLSALPRLLEFATLRAQQTGQSVDYLVDSIVTGIGRKSKLILDNLGISAVQLNEALGGASTAAASIGDVADAVGKIAEDNLKNMAGFSDNASTKLQKLSASWVNVKVALGDAANGTGILGAATEALGSQLDLLASNNIPNYIKYLNLMTFGALSGQLAQIDLIKNTAKVAEEQKKQEQIIREVDRAFKEFNGDIDAYGRAIETHIYRTELLAEFQKRLKDEQESGVQTLEKLREKQKELNDQFDQTDINDTKTLNNLADEIIAVQKLIDKYEALRKAKKVIPTDQWQTVSMKQLPLLREGEDKPNYKNLDMRLANPEIQTSDWTEESNEALRAYQEELYKTAGVAQEVGGIIGGAFANAASGQESFINSLAKMTGEIIQLYLRQSIAAMIAASIKDPTKPLPVMKIAGAAAGIAIISALFSKIGGSGSSGGGSRSIGSSGDGSRSGNLTNKGLEIRVAVEGIFQGDDFRLITNRNEQKTFRTRRG